MNKAGPFWDQRYDTEDYIFGTQANDFLQATAPQATPGMTALVPADGEGRNGVYLASLGYQVTTLDISTKAVEKASKLAATHGVELDARVADLFSWEWPTDAYDLICICFSHMLPEQNPDFIRRALRALKPAGRLIIEGYHVSQMDFCSGGPRNPAMLYSRHLMQEILAEAKIILMQETRRQLAEGPRHQGEAATLQLIATK